MSWRFSPDWRSLSLCHVLEIITTIITWSQPPICCHTSSMSVMSLPCSNTLFSCKYRCQQKAGNWPKNIYYIRVHHINHHKHPTQIHHTHHTYTRTPQLFEFHVCYHDNWWIHCHGKFILLYQYPAFSTCSFWNYIININHIMIKCGSEF